MTIVSERTGIDRERVRQGIRYRMVYIASLLAIFIMFAVQTGTRYVMNDWTRSRLERLMSLEMHRDVRLGKTTWSLGLTGLILMTRSIDITDRNGKTPFISAGPSEIGVPLIPLSVGQLEVRNVRFTNPVIFAVQTGPRTWNFSDIPQIESLKNIALMDITGGQLNVIDKWHATPSSWSPQRFQNAYFHLERPFQNQTWPFSLSFQMPHSGFTSTVDISGIGNGRVDDWYKNNHQFNVRARNISLADVQQIWPALPSMSGNVDLDLTGEGIPQKDFAVDATVTSPLMTVMAPGLGLLNVRNGVISGHFIGGQDHLEWSNTIVHLGGFNLNSDGRIANMNTKSPTYDAQLNMSTDNLQKLATFLPAVILPRDLIPTSMQQRILADRSHTITVAQALAPNRLSGSGTLVAHVTGTGKDTKVTSDFQARNVSMWELAELRPFKAFPILGLLGANRNSKLNIHLNTTPDGASRIPDGSIQIDHSQILLSGYANTKENKTHLSYYASGLDLGSIANGVTTSAGHKQLNKILGLSPEASITLGGKVDLNGIADAEGDKQSLHALVTMHNVAAELNQNEFTVSRVNGRIFATDQALQFQNVTGLATGGSFRLLGVASANPKGPLDITYQGRSLKLAAVRALATALHIKSTFVANKYLGGRLENVLLIAKGTAEKPAITMFGRARDVVFQSPSNPGRAHFASGELAMHNNVLYLKNVIGTLGRGTFGLSGAISGNATNLLFSGQHIDIAYFRKALADLGLHAPIIDQPEVIFGSVRTGLLTFKMQGKKSDFVLNATPESIYYQPAGVPKSFILTGGFLHVDSNVINMRGLTGQLGHGTFLVTGDWNLKRQFGNVSLRAKNIDLSNVKTALESAHVKSPLLAQQLLFGRVKYVALDVAGSARKPKIAATIYPDFIWFEPYGTRRTMHLSSGVVTYKNDILRVAGVQLSNARSTANIDMQLSNLSHHSRLDWMKLASRSFDLGDLSTYLLAPRTPPALRDSYKELLARYAILKPHGKVSGSFEYIAAHAGAPRLRADVALHNVGLRWGGQPLERINGQVFSAANDLKFQGITGDFRTSPFTIDGIVHNVQSNARTWDATVSANVNVADLMSTLPTKNVNIHVNASQPVPIKLVAHGDASRADATFNSTLAKAATITIDAPFGHMTTPANTPISASGSITYLPGSPATLTFNPSKLNIGATVLAWQGSYMWPAANTNKQPTVDFVVSLPNAVPIQTLLSLASHTSIAQQLNGEGNAQTQGLSKLIAGLTGGVGGSIHLTGPANAPHAEAELSLSNLSIPGLNMAGMNGVINIPDVLTLAQNFSPDMLEKANLQASINLRCLALGNITLRDIHGNVSSHVNDRGVRQVDVTNLTASVFSGNICLDGSVLLNQQLSFTLDADAHHIDIDRALTQIAHSPNEVTGVLSASACIAGSAGDKQMLARSLRGDGSFFISCGKVARFGKLQKGITLLNLLKEGIAGLNVDNIVSAVTPLKASDFKTFSGLVKLGSGHAFLSHLAYNGDELKMGGQGNITLSTGDTAILVQGSFPRTSRRVLKGPVSDLFEKLSVRGMVTAVFGPAFSNLPELPIIGDIGGTGRRAFQFVMAGNASDPDSFQKSIMKTFHWLPEKPCPEPLTQPRPAYGLGANPETPVE